MTSTSLEIERKYDVPRDFTVPDLTRAEGVDKVGEPRAFHLDATYYDTSDMRLAAHSMTLRRRTGGRDAGWHLKRPADVGRTETQAPDADQLPDELATQLRAIVRDQDLRPVVRLQTSRLELPLLDASGRELAVLADDQVESELFGAGRKSWREIEVELSGGVTDTDLIVQVGEVLAEAGARASALPSKLVRALGDRAPVIRPDDRGGSRAGQALASYLRAHRDELLRNDAGVREDDPDAVHDMRVATRRLRSTLGTFRKFLGDIDPLRDELRWIAALLGDVRDGDVLADELIEEISHTAADLVPGPVTRRIRRRLARDVSHARSELQAALTSRRYFAMLDELDQFIDATAPDLTDKAMRKRASKRLARADLSVEMALRSDLVAPSDERDHALHEARKDYKKARYAVEALTPLHEKPAKRLVSRLKALQDLLGEHQDAVVAALLLRELGEQAHASGESEFGYGVLCEQQTMIAADRRQKVPAVYRRASTPKVRAFLN